MIISHKRISIVFIAVFFISLFQFFSIFFGVNFLSQNQNKNDFLITPKQSYYNNSCERIYINDLLANDWSWAESQPWCTFKDGIYYIENLTINGGGNSSCIHISNSNVNFIIRNCTLFNTTNIADYYAGLYLNNVSNSQIIDNHFYNNSRNGMYLYSSQNNVIVNNSILNDGLKSYTGIKLTVNSENNLIFNNTIKLANYGLSIVLNSNINTVKKNNIINCTYGIYNTYSNNNSLTNNIISDYQNGIFSAACYYNNITSNTLGNSSVSGIGIISQNLENNMISENIIKNQNGTAIYVINCNDTKVINNYVNQCSFRGLYFEKANRSIINSNNISYCDSRGISIMYSHNCSIQNNKINHNSNYGIDLESGGYSSFNTNIIGNEINGNNIGIRILGTNLELKNTTIVGNMLNFNSISIDDGGVNITFLWNIIQGLLQHPSIIIDEKGKGNFTWSQAVDRLAWCNGAGIASNPYIFENVTINGRNASSCIEIQDSDPYFIIKDCMAFNSSHENHSAGIKLVNVNNGKLIGNNCSYNNRNGIYLEDCQNIDIINNTVNNNAYNGLFLQNCEYIDIINNSNSFNNNSYCGIFLNQSSHNSIIGNTIRYNYIGLWLNDSHDNENQSNIINDNIIDNKITFSTQYDDPNGNGFDLLLLIILTIFFTSLTIVGIISGLALKKRFGSKEDESQLKSKKELAYINLTASSNSEEDIHKPIEKKGILENQAKKQGLTAEEKAELQKTESEVDVRKESFICVVHKGPIVGTVYICPQCQTLYCQECVRALKKNEEGCWICNKKFD